MSTKTYPPVITSIVEHHYSNMSRNSVPRHIQTRHKDEYEIIVSLTNFLPADVKCSPRLYCITHNIHNRPRCTECEKYVNFNNNGSYNTFCSSKCAQNSKETRNKIIKTNIDRYGAETPAQNIEVLRKMKSTCIDRYGVDNIFKSNQFKADLVCRANELYGVDHFVQTEEFKVKSKQTSIEHWGTSNPQQSNIIKARVRDTTMTKYGVDSTNKLQSVKDKKQITLFDRYRPLIDTDDLGDLTPGDIYSKISDKIHFNFYVPNIGKNETKLLNEIEYQDDISIIRQYPVCGFFVDGYCKETNTVYEIDEKHHERQKEKDLERQRTITEFLGCEFIRIKDYE